MQFHSKLGVSSSQLQTALQLWEIGCVAISQDYNLVSKFQFAKIRLRTKFCRLPKNVRVFTRVILIIFRTSQHYKTPWRQCLCSNSTHTQSIFGSHASTMRSRKLNYHFGRLLHCWLLSFFFSFSKIFLSSHLFLKPNWWLSSPIWIL